MSETVEEAKFVLSIKLDYSAASNKHLYFKDISLINMRSLYAGQTEKPNANLPADRTVLTIQDITEIVKQKFQNNPLFLDKKNILSGKSDEEAAKHTLSAGDKRILSGLCREGYIAVNPCDSATNGVETKNPVIKDRKRERHKNGDPAGIRTLDHRLKRAMLYRLSYQVTSWFLDGTSYNIPLPLKNTIRNRNFFAFFYLTALSSARSVR